MGPVLGHLHIWLVFINLLSNVSGQSQVKWGSLFNLCNLFMIKGGSLNRRGINPYQARIPEIKKAILPEFFSWQPLRFYNEFTID